ncbi:MAG: hypothetical protein ABI689_13745 [Thermoanaerobaculia bacterium]
MNRHPSTDFDPPLRSPASVRSMAPGEDADDFVLAEWFALLPEPAPRSGFVLRVMSALPPRSWLDARWSRALLVAALVAVAVSAGCLLPALLPLARLVGPAGLLNLWIGAVADLAIHLTAGLSTWNAFASIGRVLGRALALPPFLVLLALNAALALTAFRGLVALSSKRSPSHARIVALSL